MSLAILYSRANVGIHAPLVTVETHLSNGMPQLSIVGLPEAAVRESKDRVRSALLNTHFEFPTRRTTINLAPADLPKEGSRFDLPIALGILAASNQIPTLSLSDYEFAGELALSGTLRPIKGILPFAVATREAKRKLIIPYGNVEEAALIRDLDIFPAKHLLDVCEHLIGNKLLIQMHDQPQILCHENACDLADIRGQQHAIRALMIAASGGHSLLMIGPPGTGKTMLANRLIGILPPLEEQQALQIAIIASLTNQGFNIRDWGRRPFRAPHHTASSVALVGGGNPPKPGEISRAHYGIIFLDELPEFNRRVLESLREPIESGSITISRAIYQCDFPAKFQLIAAMNPCPCGHLGNPQKECSCRPDHIKRYRSRLSGPLLDRIDMHLEILPLPKHVFDEAPTSTVTSADIRAKVLTVRNKQLQRSGKTNTELNVQEITQFCTLGTTEKKLLNDAMQKLGLSMRAYHRILKVARTIADINDHDQIVMNDLLEALGYRRLDRDVSTHF